MLKVKLQYFGHVIQNADLLEETLMLGKTEGRGEGDNRGWDGWMASPTQWTWAWVRSRSWWWTGKPWHAAVHGVAKSRTQVSDWTELTAKVYFLPLVSLPSWPTDPSTLPTVTLIKHVCDHDTSLLKRLTAVCRTVSKSSAQEASPSWPWPSFSPLLWISGSSPNTLT